MVTMRYGLDLKPENKKMKFIFNFFKEFGIGPVGAISLLLLGLILQFGLIAGVLYLIKIMIIHHL